jgi:hypothetical protein
VPPLPTAVDDDRAQIARANRRAGRQQAAPAREVHDRQQGRGAANRRIVVGGATDGLTAQIPAFVVRLRARGGLDRSFGPRQSGTVLSVRRLRRRSSGPHRHRRPTERRPRSFYKERNVLGHLAERDRRVVRRRLRAAWALDDHDRAVDQLRMLADELARSHPGAAASLREGMEETLTVTRLGVRGRLKRTLTSTNPCESMMRHEAP